MVNNLNKKIYFFEKYHFKSSISKLNKVLPKSLWPEEWKRIYFKGYPRFERIPLPKPSILINNKRSLYQVLNNRKSYRVPENDDLSIEEISSLMFGVAITRVEGDVHYQSYRSYPSAGARYPSEVYLILNRVERLRKGLYHYHVRTNSLEYLWEVNSEQLESCFPGQSFVASSRAVIVITAVMSRLTSKYSERSYRYALLESGHLCQNFYLIGEAINVGVCALGGFRDEAIKDLLDIKIVSNEIPLYCIAIP